MGLILKANKLTSAARVGASAAPASSDEFRPVLNCCTADRHFNDAGSMIE
jgi:hypothetical protein